MQQVLPFYKKGVLFWRAEMHGHVHYFKGWRNLSEKMEVSALFLGAAGSSKVTMQFMKRETDKCVKLWHASKVAC